MRREGLRAIPKRRFRVTTRASKTREAAPNLLQRDFTAQRPNERWTGDVTYIWTLEGWLYLAVLLDLFSRRVVGWATSRLNDEALTLEALRIALLRRPICGPLIHHTDRGSTYGGKEYLATLAHHYFRPSMSRKGDCWDNAVTESFFATIKRELVEREIWATRAEAQAAVLEYIEWFYNLERRHSTLGYVSPAEFEVTQLP
jgi:transposase InsO family protein